jgi:hypothetical protein
MLLWNIVSAAPLLEQSTLKLCSTKDAILQNAKYSYSPNPVIKGQDTFIVGTGYLSSEVRGATIRVVLKQATFPFLKVRDQTDDLCELSALCTSPIGPVEFKQAFQIPNIAPSGHYIATYELNTKDARQITCMTGDLYI